MSSASGLACPQCGYLLQGLAGLHVTCPECGLQIDVSELLRQQRVDRLDNPIYRRMAAPAKALALGWAIMWSVVFVAGGYRPNVLWMNLLGVALLVGWLAPLAVVLSFGSMREFRLSALLHVVFVGIVVLVLGGIVKLVAASIQFSHAMAMNNAGQAVREAAVALASITVALTSYWLLRRLDRYVGRQCLMDAFKSGQFIS